MKEWFDNLAPRERLVVSAGGVLVLIVLFWAIVLAPSRRSPAIPTSLWSW